MPTERTAPRQVRAAARRSAILDAAERLLCGVAPRELSTTAIAAAADVSVGSVYRYFESADDVMTALFERMNRPTSDALAAPGASDWRADLARIADIVRALHDAHPAYGRLMAHFDAEGRTVGADIAARLADRIRNQADVPPRRAALVAETTVSLFEAAERRYHRVPPAEREAAWSEGIAAVRSYLAQALTSRPESG